MAIRRLPGTMAVLLGTLALLLYGFQYITLTKFSALPPAVSYGTLSRFLQAVRQSVALDAVDGLLAVAILVLCAAVVGLEWRDRRLAIFLGYICENNRRTLVFLLACSAVFARCFFAPGALGWGGDAAGHIIYAHITAEAIARGELPVWTNYLGLGSPYLQFYGFLFYYAVGLVQLVCSDVYIAVKVVLGGSHIISGVGMYLWVRCVTCSRRAALLGGMAYVLSFWHFQQVIFMGRLPLGLFYALLPWPFYFFEYLRRVGNRPMVVCAAGLSLGLLAFTHPGYAFWATVFWGGYALVRLGGVWALPRRADLLKGTLVAGIGSVGLSAYLTVGMLLERGATGLHGGIDLVNVPDPSWLQVFSWSNFRFWLLPVGVDHWYGGYVGLSLAAVAVGGLVVFARRLASWRHEPLVAGWLALLLALLLVFAYRWSALQALPVVQAFNAGRYLMFVVLFLACAAGVSTQLLLRGRRAKQDRILALLLLVIVADLGAATFQQPYLSPDIEPMAVNPIVYEEPRQAAESFRELDELPGYRITWLRDKHNPFLAMAQLIYRTGTPVASAPSAHTLRAVSEFYLPWKDWSDQAIAASDEDFDQRRKFVHDGLGLLNMRYVLLQTEQGVRTIEQPHYTPLIAAPLASKMPTDEIESHMRERGVEGGWDAAMFRAYWLVLAMGVDLERNRCERIFLAESDDVPHAEGAAADLQVEVLEHRLWHERVEMRVRVNAACFARLAYAYYPHLQVYVDGIEVEPLQTAGRFMALHLPPGEHEIRIEAGLSPLRVSLLALGAMLCMIGAFAVWRSSKGA